MYIKYTKEFLQSIVNQCNSWAEVCVKLGIKPISGAQGHIIKRAKFFGIEFKHFRGRGWAKGLILKRKPTQQYLIKNIAQENISSSHLRTRLLNENIKQPICEHCGLKEWQGQSIPLELDHKNCDCLDNRLENLQILCPNCHALKHKNESKQKKLFQQTSRNTPKTYKPRPNKRKVIRPSKEELEILLLKNKNWCAIGRQYGVSDNAVRKWARWYGLLNISPSDGNWKTSNT